MKKFFCIVLCFAVFLSLTSSAFATEESTTQDGVWIVVTEDDGSIHLENSSTGEVVIYAFKIDEHGNEHSVDLVEYANELNSLPVVPDSPNVTPYVESQEVVPYKRSLTRYNYKETHSYQGIGTGLKVTPDVVGPATLTYGESFTISAGYGSDLTLTSEAKNAIAVNAGYSWNASLSSCSNFSIAKEIPAGRTGYIEFKPYYYVSEGILTATRVQIPSGFVLSSTDYEAWGQCPMRLASGFADGIYSVRYV